MSEILILLLSATVSSMPIFGQDTLSRVYADRKNQAHVVYGEGKLQWIGSFAHGFTFFNRSPRRS
jgi:hypothetical protein